MKAIRTKEVNENVKAANSCLRKAKWQAKELAVFTGEVVRLMDKEGHSLQGFFNRVEFVLVDVVCGSIATLIGAFGTYALRKHKFACTWPPVIANMVIVPFVLRYGYGL